MINVNQLNENIDELEKEIQNIKSVSKVYEELSKLSAEIKVDKGLHNTIIKDLSEVSLKFNTTSSALTDAIHKFNQVSNDSKTILCNSISEIIKDNKSASNQLIEGYKNYENEVSAKIFDAAKKLNSQYEGFEKNIDSRLDSINRNYKEEIQLMEKRIDDYTKNINKDVMNQLDKNEKTIGTEVKNLNDEIQNTLMQFITAKSENIEAKFSEKEKTDQANAKTLKILLGVSIIFGILGIALQIALRLY